MDVVSRLYTKDIVHPTYCFSNGFLGDYSKVGHAEFAKEMGLVKTLNCDFRLL